MVGETKEQQANPCDFWIKHKCLHIRRGFSTVFFYSCLISCPSVLTLLSIGAKSRKSTSPVLEICAGERINWFLKVLGSLYWSQGAQIIYLDWTLNFYLLCKGKAHPWKTYQKGHWLDELKFLQKYGRQMYYMQLHTVSNTPQIRYLNLCLYLESPVEFLGQVSVSQPWGWSFRRFKGEKEPVGIASWGNDAQRSRSLLSTCSHLKIRLVGKLCLHNR